MKTLIVLIFMVLPQIFAQTKFLEKTFKFGENTVKVMERKADFNLPTKVDFPVVKIFLNNEKIFEQDTNPFGAPYYGAFGPFYSKTKKYMIIIAKGGYGSKALIIDERGVYDKIPTTKFAFSNDGQEVIFSCDANEQTAGVGIYDLRTMNLVYLNEMRSIDYSDNYYLKGCEIIENNRYFEFFNNPTIYELTKERNIKISEKKTINSLSFFYTNDETQLFKVKEKAK